MDQAQYEVYEQIILSGQMAEDDIARLFDEEPEFLTWYNGRAERRRLEREMVGWPNNDNKQ